MCKLKTISGRPMRADFQAFEIDALKYAVEQDIKSGETFTFGRSGEQFLCEENSDAFISIYRDKVNKTLTARKVDGNATATSSQATAPNINDITAAITSALAQFQTPAPAVDMDELLETVNSMIDDKLSAATTHTITINNAPAVEIEGELHTAFNDVLLWCSNRQPVYLFGPAGTGKNVLSEQVAKAMKLPFYYAGCLQQKYELEGFINAAGEYQETEFFRAFRDGGVFLFDEIDGTTAEVLIAFNAALANRYYNFPKHGRIEAHPDFVVIAAGNTAGRGASDAYNGRFQLDASTLDRFVFVSLDYNEKIELASANGDAELVEFCHDLRRAIDAQHLTYTVSTRAMKRMALGIAAGMDAEKLMRQAICGGWDIADIELLQNNLSFGNKYTNIFKDL